ncbi:MAG: hypothetical protein M3008_05215 [Chloroflexota bacterium]|nr:hypothetical protein [Chloroflexota bacterium]
MPSRAQLKAMEARAASAARASAFARGDDMDDAPNGSQSISATRSARTMRNASRSGARVGTDRSVGSYPMPEFSVRTEMEYHRRDLIRLLLVAAALVVIYIVLWFFLH